MLKRAYIKQGCCIKFHVSIFIAALMIMPAARAFGENVCLGEKVYSVGIRTTHSKPNDADQGKWYTGIQARMHWIPGLGVEGSIDYRRNTYHRDTEVSVYPVQASLLAYLIPRCRGSPLLLGGTGWYYTRVSDQQGVVDTQNRFGIHAGAGFEYLLNEILSLDASYRYVWLEKVSAKNKNNIENTYQDKGSMITLALNYLF